MNRAGREGRPFFFAIDFDLENYFISPVSPLLNDVFFDIDGYRSPLSPPAGPRPSINEIRPVNPDVYRRAFDCLKNEIRRGNTYVLNLTFPSLIQMEGSLSDIYFHSKAAFRLYFKNSFVVFSPERFVRIEKGIIRTCPMKGTIDASVENAESIILADEKERAEHVMIVDLLRNDLSMVAGHVRLSSFRYVEKINAGGRDLLQVSSGIEGVLDENWRNRIGDIIVSMLPAGSISGTPKKKTVEIIRNIEACSRGWYTGVFGYYDSGILDSAVMIRFIEKKSDGSFCYRSGGGITIDSDPEKEYRELIEKIYIPLGETQTEARC